MALLSLQRNVLPKHKLVLGLFQNQFQYFKACSMAVSLHFVSPKEYEHLAQRKVLYIYMNKIMKKQGVVE
jgi:hypothetical protein